MRIGTKPIQLLAAVIIALTLAACAEPVFKAGIDFERWRAGLQKASLDVGNYHFSYLAGGSGENILLVHGFGANKDTWCRFARYLTDGYRIVAVDLPGHGESSSKFDDNYDIPFQANRLALFTKAMGLNRFHIMGSSMGGAIAIYYSFQNPEHIITLGLMNSAGVLSTRPSEYLQRLEKGENLLLVNSKKEFEDMLNFVMVEPPYMPWFIRNMAYEQYHQRQAINQKIFNDIATGEVREIPFLHEIDVPVFILWGQNDRVLDVSCVEVFETRLPNTDTVILKNVGHAPMYEAPEIAAKHYLEFLQKN